MLIEFNFSDVMNQPFHFNGISLVCGFISSICTIVLNVKGGLKYHNWMSTMMKLWKKCPKCEVNCLMTCEVTKNSNKKKYICSNCYHKFEY